MAHELVFPFADASSLFLCFSIVSVFYYSSKKRALFRLDKDIAAEDAFAFLGGKAVLYY